MQLLSQPSLMIGRVLLMLLALVSTPIEASTERPDEITRASVICEMNRYRASFGLPPLEEDPRLHLAAEDRMVDMEEVGYWGHDSPEGISPFVWLKKHGYRHRIAGENLAAGYETTPVLVESWMESPGHRANILSPEFSDVGVALIDGGTTRRLVGRSVVVVFASEQE